MGKFAKILVDIPVEELDQSFDYRIPKNIKIRLKLARRFWYPLDGEGLLVLLLVLLRKVQ